MKVGGQSTTFMVDTGAEHSVVTTAVAPLHRQNSNHCWGHGGHGSPLILQGHLCQLGSHLVTSEFRFLLECLITC